MEALCGAESGDFVRWGMTMVVPEYAALNGQVWTVRRARASLRAGEVSLKQSDCRTADEYEYSATHTQWTQRLAPWSGTDYPDE